MKLTLEEEERQVVLLALAHLSIERPGWDDLLNRIACKMDNHSALPIMPIKPENKSRYPKDWNQIRARRLKRANSRCEWCGVENGAMGYRNSSGGFISLTLDQAEARHQGGEKVIMIVLTLAHIDDRSPENCADENLALLCQRCHLGHDRDQHQQSRLANERKAEEVAGQLFLFERRDAWPGN